jgi:hypothetical protein
MILPLFSPYFTASIFSDSNFMSVFFGHSEEDEQGVGYDGD